MSAGWGLPEASVFGLQMATFSHVLSRGFSLYVVSLCFVLICSFYKDTSWIGLGPTQRASFSLNTALKALYLKTVTFRITKR